MSVFGGSDYILTNKRAIKKKIDQNAYENNWKTKTSSLLKFLYIITHQTFEFVKTFRRHWVFYSKAIGLDNFGYYTKRAWK